ncbi:MAG: ACS family MFS transporter [Acidobacteria bacterium]|nr:ACS family MFS transporter [Acidobacteriota bacterium]
MIRPDPLLRTESSASCRVLPWPKRFDIALLGFTGLVIAYCDRINISVAAPVLMRERGWDTARMGWVLSAFYFGYVAMMIPVGVLVDRYGPKRVFAFSITWWSLFTALTPLPKSLPGMAFMRALMGAGEGGTQPATNAMLVRWFPRSEHARAAAFCWSGGYVGPIVGVPLATAILSVWGWEAIFYLFAVSGIVWLFFWQAAATDRPEDSRAVTAAELALIRAGEPPQTKTGAVPWGRMLRLRPLWALLILHFSTNWLSYFMNSWLPTFLMMDRGFSLSNMALGASFPFLSAFLGANATGALADHFSRRHDRTVVRKALLLLYAASAVAIALVPLFRGPVITVVLLSLSMVFKTGASPVVTSNSLDIAPRFAGTVVGIQNCFANLAGILAPVVIGYIVRTGGWNVAFYLTAVICLAGMAAFLLFGKAERLLD